MPESKPDTLAKVYDPQPVEERWWKAWEAADLFSAPEDPAGKTPYCIVIPPPNVTGSLHMGHALNNTLQDILIRFHRMEGEAALWVFGMDHAGIATQNVVERQLKQEGKSRHDLGREAFIQRVWKWKEESGGVIRHQLKKLGASLDYKNERFTMDEGLSRAVKEVFIRLFEEGKIYRAQRLINWCPRCRTALSDLEVEHEEIKSHLWHIRYPLEGNPQEGIVVATTRPETLLGDTAVAVHPEDERYRHLIGKNLVLPFLDRLLPVIADPMVDREFGSGAVKITPAHDFNDFEVGNRHSLERVNVLTEDGRMNEAAGHFQGQDRFEARTNIERELKELGLLISIEDYQTSVGHCYRCKTIVEPYLSLQWFVRTKELAQEAIQAVKKGRTRIIPTQWENTYFRWMEDIQDWCISRQLWWGHRIPVWYCGRCADEEIPGGGIHVSREELKSCPRCGHNGLKQDNDVLDTWFSSALWPFSTLGWPKKTPKLKNYYPTSTLVTAFDILFFWVARMMMMGLHFTEEVPFQDVYIHALVRDPEGQKMSKSKGNVIDPLEQMEKFGTDAFRFTLAAFAAQGRDIKLSEERVIGYRNFCNKIWNAARFVFSTASPHANLKILQEIDFEPEKLPVQHPISQWILAKLSDSIASVRRGITNYRFNDAAMEIYHFFWGIYCDWFLELIKEDLKSGESEWKKEFGTVALLILDQALRLLHPFMPFMSEELWQNLAPRDGALLPAAKFPKPFPRHNFLESKQLLDIVTALVEKIRQIRKETGVPENQRLKRVSIYSPDLGSVQKLEDLMRYTMNLTGVSDLWVNDSTLEEEKGVAKGITRFKGVYVIVDLKGLVDLKKERQRQEKEKAKQIKGLKSHQNSLDNPKFRKNAPEELVKEKEEKIREYQKRIQEIEEALRRL